MLFSSFGYMMGFLPVVLLGCWLLRRWFGERAAQGWVLAASLVFYAWYRPANLPYLLGSVLANWLVAQRFAATEGLARKRWLQAGLVLNVGYLCVFKYMNLFLGSIPFLRSHVHLPELAFPLGISFFTLAQIMYLVDCYEGLLPAMGLFDLATFVSFFPYVISGPIAKSKRMVHQFGDFGGKPALRSELVSRGLMLFALGLAKKVVLADAFATIADFGYATPLHRSATDAWAFTIAYTLQLYFDFSGYTDMARGSAMMLGIEIPRNFDAPLRSKSIIEFWQRWHISLSNFITSYLFTPLIKSFGKVTLRKSAAATVLAMAIAGLWHGPAWMFVVYGLVHGVGLAINQYWRKKKMPKLPAFASWLLTFVLVDVSLVFFRAPDFHASLHMLAAMADPRGALDPVALLTLRREGLTAWKIAVALAGTVAAFYGKSSDDVGRNFVPRYANAFAAACAIVFCCAYLVFNNTQDFVYFKF